MAPDTTTFAERARRPAWRFVLRHPAHLLAVGFGAGLAPVLPGTFGTLLAFPLYALLALRLAPLALLAIIGAMFVAGMWLCARTGEALGRADHPAIVWDEITAFLLVLVFTPPQIAWQIAAFLLFRAFDILKPPPIRYYDRALKSGFGAMFDDLLAAFYTLIVLAIAKTLTE